MENRDLETELISIKDFSLHSGLSVSALRHYERIGVFSPAIQGIAFENKYRYYSQLQVTTIKMPRVLADMGISLDAIKELNRSRTPLEIIRLIRRNKHEMVGRMRNLRESCSLMDAYRDLLIEAISVTETAIEVIEMPMKRIVMGAVNHYGGRSFIDAYTLFCRTDHKSGLYASYPIGGYFDSMEIFLQEPSRPTHFFSLYPNGHERMEKGLYLTGYTRGYYGQTNDLPKRLEMYAKMNGLTFIGPVYGLYLTDEISEIDPERYLLRVSVPVMEKRRNHYRKL